MRNIYFVMPCLLALTFFLGACNQKPAAVLGDTAATGDDTTAVLVGCYSVEKDNPAQIRINHRASIYSMQMKENSSQVWDVAEALNNPSVADGWHFFHGNTINLSSKDIAAIIARPDEVMALAALKSGAMNLNPHLDSDYVIMIAGMVNTVYRVACDDVPLDLMTPVNPHVSSDENTKPAT